MDKKDLNEFTKVMLIILAIIFSPYIFALVVYLIFMLPIALPILCVHWLLGGKLF